MFENNLLIIISLLFVVSMLAMISNKIKISYPVFLVIAGLIISLIPNIPRIALSPDLVFTIFLPPLLYAAAWNTSWKDFWSYRRPIGLLAFTLVIFTSCGVAYISHRIIPDFSLAMGFLLGGIISPPDAVAAASVLNGLPISRRVVTILEGESLLNDASSLIVFQFALSALITGQFVFLDATASFFRVVILGILIGLAIAHVVYAIHRFLPTTPSIDTAITLISPYLMYVAAEQFHSSGVLAVVCGGLFLSFRSHEIFNYESRLQAQSVWGTLVFMLNGIVFILIGLQLHRVVRGLETYALWDAVWYGVVVSVATILIRIIWVFPGAYLPRWLSKRIRQKESKPGWKNVFVTAWSGMRGVVSLAAALSVPLTISGDKAFPHRNLILFITFIVILFTLVLQGLSLPWLIRLLHIEMDESKPEQELDIRSRLAGATLDYIESAYKEDAENIEAFKRVKERYERMADLAAQKKVKMGDKSSVSFLPKYRQMLLELVAVRRRELSKMKKEKQFDDELLRAKEQELDLEEARLRS
jgi:monovalent cation/hydrogen antiporter